MLPVGTKHPIKTDQENLTGVEVVCCTFHMKQFTSDLKWSEGIWYVLIWTKIESIESHLKWVFLYGHMNNVQNRKWPWKVGVDKSDRRRNVQTVVRSTVLQTKDNTLQTSRTESNKSIIYGWWLLLWSHTDIFVWQLMFPVHFITKSNSLRFL